jgi:hypothetical protein
VLARLVGAVGEHGEDKVASALEAALNQQRIDLLDVITPSMGSTVITVPSALAGFVIEAGKPADYDHLLLIDGGAMSNPVGSSHPRALPGSQASGLLTRVPSALSARPRWRPALRRVLARTPEGRGDQPPSEHRSRLLREAHFPDLKTLDQIDWQALKGQPKILELARCQFITRAKTVIAAGPLRPGKQCWRLRSAWKLLAGASAHSLLAPPTWCSRAGSLECTDARSCPSQDSIRMKAGCRF